MTRIRERTFAALIASLMVVSLAGAAVAPAAVSAADGPEGMVALGSGQISEDVPEGAALPIRASDLEGAVYASEHADSLEVMVTTPERADEYLGPNASVVANDEVAIVLRDDEVHEGRDVAINLDVLEKGVGFVPKVAYGTHESGEQWRSPIERDGTVGVFHVPEFSSNSVTFTGGITLEGDAAGDGTQYQYELDTLDGVEDFGINVTGVSSSTTETVTRSGLANGDTPTVEVGGNTPPSNQTVTFVGERTVNSESRTGTDEASGSTSIDVGGNVDPEAAQVTFEGKESTTGDSVSGSGVTGGDATPISVGGNVDPRDESVTVTGSTTTSNGDQSGTLTLGNSDGFSNPGNIEPTGPSNNNPTVEITANSQVFEASDRTEDQYKSMFGDSEGEITFKNVGGTIDTVTIDVYMPDSGAVSDVYLVTGEKADGDYGEGQKVADAVSFGTETKTIDISDVSVPEGTTVTFEFVTAPESSASARVWTDDSVDEGLVSNGVGGVANNAADAELSAGSASVETTIGANTVTIGDLAPGESTTKEVDMSLDDSSISASGEGANVDYYLSKTDRTATKDPGVDINDDGTVEASHSGILREGETATFNVDLSTASDSLGWQGTGAAYDADASWTEVTQTEDPAVDVDGDGTDEASVSGLLGPGETATRNVTLTTGSQTLDWSTTAGSFDYSASWDEITQTDSPSVDVDGDGTAEASVSGLLNDGETVTRDVSALSTGSNSIDVSTSGGTTGLEVDWTETTTTENPTVTVNGYETSHDGQLAEGETVSLATNEAWLREGTNNVTVTTNSPSNGPESLVGFEYSHDAAGTTKSVDVEATSWTESFNVSHTFPSQVADAESTLTFNEHVVEIDQVEVRRNGGAWNQTNDYTLNGTDLTVQLGDVGADSEIDIRATGYKVGVQNGAIDVLEPTVDGDKLDTKIEIENRTENFLLDLSGMDRVHYAAEESWTGDSAYVVVDSGGDQRLHLADANEGSTARVRTIPLEVEPVDGEIAVHVENPEAPRFRFSDEGVAESSSVDVTYHDTTTGNRYVLWSVTQNREIDADRAESPVKFSTGLTSSQTFEVRQRDRSDSVGGAVPETERSGSSAPLVLVVPAVGISVAGLFWAGRRFGGATGLRGNAVLLVGSTIVAVAALELVSPGTISSIWRATVFALGDAAASGVGAVIAAIAVFFALWQINARTSADVPSWVTIPTVGIASVMALEAIRPGSVLGALQGVLTEVGGLVVLIVLGIVAYVIYQRRKTQQAEASTPDTQVTLDLGRGED